MAPAVPESSRHLCCPTCHALFRTRPSRCPLDGAVLEPAIVDPMIGTVIADRYQVEAVIGEGGIGRVYRARHVRISRRYAIKVPFGELAFDDAIRRRLANEAEAASRVQHPNLVGVVDVGETAAGLFYLAMDLVEGSSLAAIVAGGAMAPVRALTLIAQIADGLAHAHARELVHRDLKPDNVIVELDGEGHESARVVDFGIALVQDESHRRLTAQGMVIGTPEYMAPEQLTGAPVDGRTDVFALGLVLYELVTGVTPFEGSSLEIATRNLTAALPPMSARGKVAVDERIETLVRWMTEKAPSARPATAELVADEARAIIAALPGGRPAPPSRRKPITFTPLAAGQEPARPSPTAEAWSPIVVPIAGEASARVQAGIAATVRAPVTPGSSAPPLGTIKTPAVPMPAPALRTALGSEPPPPAGAIVEIADDTVVRSPPPAGAPTAPTASAAPSAIVAAKPATAIAPIAPTMELDAADLRAVAPPWQRPAVVIVAVAAAVALIGLLAYALR